MVNNKKNLRIARAVGISVYGQSGITELSLAVEPDSAALDEVVRLLHGLETNHWLKITGDDLKMPMDEQKGALTAVVSAIQQLKQLELSAETYGDYHAAYLAGQYLEKMISRIPIEDFLLAYPESDGQNI